MRFYKIFRCGNVRDEEHLWLLSQTVMKPLEANYADKFTKVSNSLGCWGLRRLALLGKITVLKSLIVSQLVYILSPLPTNQRVLEEINTLFFNFLWNGKGDKIKQNTMISNYSQGGLRMIYLISFNKALKSIWVKKYLDPENHGKWKFFLTGNYKTVAVQSFSEETLIDMTYLNLSTQQMPLLCKSYNFGQRLGECELY